MIIIGIMEPISQISQKLNFMTKSSKENIMEQTVTIDSNGSMTIPNEYRQILGLSAGDKITVQLKGNKLVLVSPHDPVKIVQKIVKRYAPRDSKESIVDELIAERRREGFYE
jgi:AbrB family looped-hinge helix DNA binding protein